MEFPLSVFRHRARHWRPRHRYDLRPDFFGADPKSPLQRESMSREIVLRVRRVDPVRDKPRRSGREG